MVEPVGWVSTWLLADFWMEVLAFLLPLHHLYSSYSLFYSVSNPIVNYPLLQSPKIQQWLYYHLLIKAEWSPDHDQECARELSLGMWVGGEGCLKWREQWIELNSCVWHPYVYKMLDLLTDYPFLLCCRYLHCHRRLWSLVAFKLYYSTLKKPI